MSDVLTIPGIETVHPRSSWQSIDPKYMVTGPVAPWSTIDTAAIHYTAADDLIDGDPGEHAENLPAYIRAMQRAYVDARGYSLGYWWAVDWLGGVWQIRGWDIKSAANSGHNDHTGPILVLVDGNDPATHLAARSIRGIIAEGQRRSRDTWAIKGHGQLRRETGIGTPTACCGTGLQIQIDIGEFIPLPDEPTIPPTPSEDDDMANNVRITDNGSTPTDIAVFTVSGVLATWQRDGNAEAALEDAGLTAGDKLVRRAGLKGLTLVGPAPDDDNFAAYAGAPANMPGRTRGSDFGARLA